jgi:hypothetical protein
MQKNNLLRYINMIILTTNTSQTFPTIPTRVVDEEDMDIWLSFTNETTKDVYYLFSSVRYLSMDILYLGCSEDELDFLKENTFYNLVVYFIGTNEIIYKDRVFCTNQPKAEFTINEGEYILPNIDNNSYITI